MKKLIQLEERRVLLVGGPFDNALVLIQENQNSISMESEPTFLRYPSGEIQCIRKGQQFIYHIDTSDSNKFSLRVA